MFNNAAIILTQCVYIVDSNTESSTTPSPHPSIELSKLSEAQRSVQTSENESSSLEAETPGGESMADTEGEGSSEPLTLNEIELVFKPHPFKMAGDNSLIKALKENFTRYIKTTANATGKLFFFSYLSRRSLIED